MHHWEEEGGREDASFVLEIKFMTSLLKLVTFVQCLTVPASESKGMDSILVGKAVVINVAETMYLVENQEA